MFEVWRLRRPFDKLADRDLRRRLDSGKEVGVLKGSGPTLEAIACHIPGVRPTPRHLEAIGAAIADKGVWRYWRGTAVYQRPETGDAI